MGGMRRRRQLGRIMVEERVQLPLHRTTRTAASDESFVRSDLLRDAADSACLCSDEESPLIGLRRKDAEPASSARPAG